MRKMTGTLELAPALQNPSAILTEIGGKKKQKTPPPASGLSPTPQPLPHSMLGRKGNDVACSLETRTVHFQNKARAVTCTSKFFLNKGTIGGG